MKYINKLTLGIVLAAGLFTACSDDDDIEIPGGLALDGCRQRRLRRSETRNRGRARNVGHINGVCLIVDVNAGRKRQVGLSAFQGLSIGKFDLSGSFVN